MMAKSKEKIHYQQGGIMVTIVKRPACNPTHYEWLLTTDWNKVTCKECLKYRSSGQ